jgi:hypothetical protein
MRAFKFVLLVIVLLLVALGAGYWWGVSGRGAAQQALDAVQQQVDVANARGHILDARVSLYNQNFGDAQRQLDDAKAPLTKARDAALARQNRQSADAFSAALAHVQDAQRLAGRLDANANKQADEALKAIATSGSSR